MNQSDWKYKLIIGLIILAALLFYGAVFGQVESITFVNSETRQDVVTLDKEVVHCVTGWRNGFGDTYVRILRIYPESDTTEEKVEGGIPSDIKPGDLIVREYKGLDFNDFGIKS